MSGYIAEFFGYRAEDQSSVAMNASESMMCPFLESICTKSSLVTIFPLDCAPLSKSEKVLLL